METSSSGVSVHEKEIRELINSYERFVPKQLLAILGKSDIKEVKLGDHVEQILTILFSDIRDFTSISELLSPKETFEFINNYLSQMETYIRIYNGFIDKYIGDSIMAVFHTSADDAIDCSLLMQKQLSFYNENRKKMGLTPINIGIGLNTGLCVLGTVGGCDRMEGTVISDTVNLSSRIESLTKKYGVKLLISENTLNNISDTSKYSIRFIDRVLVKGKKQSQSIYEVFDNDDEKTKELKLKYIPMFEEALAHYHYKHIDRAIELLEKCIELNPEDKPAQVYLERCKNFSRSGIHEGAAELSWKLEWNSGFAVGNPIIDKQHLFLISNALDLLKSVDEGYNKREIEMLIKLLNDYVVIHFQTEEKHLEIKNYPFLNHQRSQHQNFIKSFEQLKNEISSNEFSKTYMMFRIQILIIDWIVNHILKEDKHFSNYIRNNDL